MTQIPVQTAPCISACLSCSMRNGCFKDPLASLMLHHVCFLDEVFSPRTELHTVDRWLEEVRCNVRLHSTSQMSQTIDCDQQRRPNRPGSGKEITLKTRRKQRIHPNSCKKPGQSRVRTLVHRRMEIVCGYDDQPYDCEDEGWQAAVGTPS